MSKLNAPAGLHYYHSGNPGIGDTIALSFVKIVINHYGSHGSEAVRQPHRFQRPQNRDSLGPANLETYPASVPKP